MATMAIPVPPMAIPVRPIVSEVFIEWSVLQRTGRRRKASQWRFIPVTIDDAQTRVICDGEAMTRT